MQKVLLLIIALLSPMVASAKQPTKRPTDEKRGETLFQQNCWQCHGKRGKGKGPLAESLGGPLKPISQRYQTEEYSDLVKVILQGKGAMPGFDQVMNRADARRILIWLEDARVTKKKKPKKPKKPTKNKKSKASKASKKPAGDEGTQE